MVEEHRDAAPVPSTRRKRWPPAPLTCVVLGLVVWNVVVLWLAFHGTLERDIGNDPAGDGMARAFREAFALAAGVGIGVLVLPYLLIRNVTVRAVLVAILFVASMLTLALIG